MNSKKDFMNFIPCNTSRRSFISSCAACAACMSVVPLSSLTFTSCSSAKKMRIRIIYALHAVVQPKPDWPNIGFDFGPVMGNINTMLIKQFPGMEKALFARKDKLQNTVEVFVNDATAYPNELVKPVKDSDDIHLVIMLAGG